MLTFPNANAEWLQFVHGVATRTLSTPGYYSYATPEMREWKDIGSVIRAF